MHLSRRKTSPHLSFVLLISITGRYFVTYCITNIILQTYSTCTINEKVIYNVFTV